MIIYNVTLKVDTDISDAWMEWMKATHMPALMGTGLFIDCRLCRLLEQDEADGLTFIAQYSCEEIGHYNRYIDEYAEGFRAESFKLFGSKFIAFRTLMEIV